MNRSVNGTKRPFLHELMYEEYKILPSLVEKISLAKFPENNEERFALFLLEWLKRQINYTTLVENFTEAYESGMFAPYTKENEQLDKAEFDHIVQDIVREFLDILKSFEEIQVLEWKDIISKLIDGEKKLSEEQYKKLLFLKYCYNFPYWRQLSSRKWEVIKCCILQNVRLLRLVVKDDYLLKQARINVKSKIKKPFNEDAFKKVSPSPFQPGNFNNLRSFFNNYFFIHDVDLEYANWKDNILGRVNFKERLLHSLYIQLYSSSECANISKKLFKPGNYEKIRQIITSLHYWYYGVIEGYYTDVLFDILHSKKDSYKKTVLVRLISLKQDVEIHNFLCERYKSYCKRNGISEEHKISLLSANIYHQLPDDFMSGSIDCEANYFNSVLKDKTQIQLLFKLLVENGFIENDENTLNLLAYRFTGRHSICGKILWKGSRNDLFHLIFIIAHDDSRRWKKCASFFVDTNNEPINCYGAATICKQNVSDKMKTLCSHWEKK